jgi:hypothetical protein
MVLFVSYYNLICLTEQLHLLVVVRRQSESLGLFTAGTIFRLEINYSSCLLSFAEKRVLFQLKEIPQHSNKLDVFIWC